MWRIGLGFAGVFALLLIAGVGVTLAFDENELPKVVGAALGAFFSASVAILLFYVGRLQDRVKAADDLQRLKRAYWVDTFTTLPAVYVEWHYWKVRSGEEDSRVEKQSARSLDLIREHLKSAFYQANLSQLPRLPIEAQSSLMTFHDDLRIVVERVEQIAPRVRQYEQWMTEGLTNFDEPAVRDLLIEVAELAKGLSELLATILLYGWHAQEQLDDGGKWRSEYFATTSDGNPTPRPDWIGGVLALRDSVKRPPSQLPEDVQ